ncbi:hypothetical protein LB551_00920 [Mesorhizobium sp. BR1-1-2]|nr:hypothetical protein [Mesorhizobium sp. BR1-1-2]
MPEPRPPAPNDIRLRKILDETLVAPHWPEGFVMRSLGHGDAPALHALLTEVFDDGADGPFDEWWSRVSGDPEFDPALCFLVIDAKACWRRRRCAGRAPSLGISPCIRRRGAGASARR